MCGIFRNLRENVVQLVTLFRYSVNVFHQKLIYFFQRVDIAFTRLLATNYKYILVGNFFFIFKKILF